MKKNNLSKVLLVATLSIFLATGTYQAIQHTSKGYEVLEVLDGDTFVIEKAQRVRLLGVDAPDLEYCGGEEAKEELEKMIGKNRVYLEEIVTDKLARIVALVYVGNTPLNTEMAKKGWVENNST